MADLFVPVSISAAASAQAQLFASAADPARGLRQALDTLDGPMRQQALRGEQGCALALQLSALVMARDRPDDVRALHRVLTDDVMPQASASERAKLNDALERISPQQQAFQVSLGRMPATGWEAVCNDKMRASHFLRLYTPTRDQASTLVYRELVALADPKVMMHLTSDEVVNFLYHGALSWRQALPYLGPLEAGDAWLLVMANRCDPADLFPSRPLRGRDGVLLDQAARITLADRLKASRMFSDARYRQVLGEDPALTLQLVQAGKVEFKRAARLLGDLQIADVQRLVDAGRASFAQWACLVPLTQQVLQDGVGRGLFRRADLRLPGHNRYGLALALWSWGHIDDTTARRYVLAHWTPEHSIPEVITQQLTHYPDEHTLMEVWPLPSSSKRATRNAWMWRCLAMWWTEKEAGRIRLATGTTPPETTVAQTIAARATRVAATTPSGLTSLLPGPVFAWFWPQPPRSRAVAVAPEAPLVLAPSRVPSPEPPVECMACMETIEVQDLAQRLPGCQHDVQLCGDCFTRGLQAEAWQRCADPGCHRTLNLSDGQFLEWPADRMDTTAVRLVTRAREVHPAFWECPTEHCPGGLPSLDNAPPSFTCRFCACSVSLSEQARLRRTMTAEDMQQVDMLLASASERRGHISAAGGAFTGLVRECYHCGVPTRHEGGCSHMRCSACHRDWDFVHGAARGHNYLLDVQQYVPHRSWLVKLGLYEGLTPGAVRVQATRVLAAQIEVLKRENNPQSAASSRPQPATRWPWGWCVDD